VMEDRINMTQLRLNSLLGENMIYFQKENETLGPFQQKGWWNNADPVCSDNKGGGKVVSIRGTTTWQLLELDWDDSKPDAEKGNTVVAFRKDEDK